jgi:hypothetical protein
MSKPPTDRRRKAEFACAQSWQAFYHGDGRTAVAALMTEFDVYTPAPKTADAMELARREGQRDVLLRIVQLLGLKPDSFPTQAWEDTDILDRMMRHQ